MRWPSAWNEPRLLNLVKDTPVNCLVADWAPENQEKLGPMLEQGGKMGLAFVRLAEKEQDAGGGIPVVPLMPRADVRQESSSAVLAFSENVWPCIKLSSSGARDTADAGPTGVPWVDSNGWFIRLARTLAPEKSIWVVADPPKERGALSAEAYLLALADAAAYGGKWVVSLDETLSAGLAAGNSQAVSAWKRITAALAFYEKHRDWRTYEPFGVLGVLSDYAGENEFLATEALNLINRRHLAFRILDKTNETSLSFRGLKAVLYVDEQPPEPGLRDKLLSFARAGGLLICPPSSAALAAGDRVAEESHPRFEVHALGKGRVAVAKEDLADPYVLAADAHTLLSRRHDLVRVWNASPTITYYAGSPNGKAVVEILNYARRPAPDMSLRVMRPYRSARLWSLETEAPASLQILSEGGTVELHMPPVSVYAAIELDA